MKNIKYFCRSCKKVQSPKLILSDNPNSTIQLESDVIKDFRRKIIKQDGSIVNSGIIGRQLECGHFIRISDPGFTDETNENLGEWETQIIRREIDKTMIGKTKAEVENQILLWCSQYQIFLKIVTKQKQQAKYAQLYLDQLKERFEKQLSPEEKQDLDTRFAHFLEQRPTTNKVIEREIKRTDLAAKKDRKSEDDVLEKIKAMLKKTGKSGKELFRE